MIDLSDREAVTLISLQLYDGQRQTTRYFSGFRPRGEGQQRIGGNYSASPIYADGKIYIQSEQGDAIVLKPSKEFKQIAKNSLGERTLASYAVVDSALLIRTEKSLYRIEKK